MLPPKIDLSQKQASGGSSTAATNENYQLTNTSQKKVVNSDAITNPEEEKKEIIRNTLGHQRKYSYKVTSSAQNERLHVP